MDGRWNFHLDKIKDKKKFHPDELSRQIFLDKSQQCVYTVFLWSAPDTATNRRRTGRRTSGGANTGRRRWRPSSSPIANGSRGVPVPGFREFFRTTPATTANSSRNGRIVCRVAAAIETNTSSAKKNHDRGSQNELKRHRIQFRVSPTSISLPPTSFSDSERNDVFFFFFLVFPETNFSGTR